MSGNYSLTDSLYQELRNLARARLHRLRPGQTLQPTDLVHEAYVRLKKKPHMQWDHRGHFFGAAARAMRDILVEHARRKGALKRGGDRRRVEFEENVTVMLPDGEKTLGELLAIHHVLTRLQEQLPEHGELVLLRYFAGMSMKQIAEMRGVSRTTVERQWRFTRAWLQKHLDDASVMAAVV